MNTIYKDIFSVTNVDVYPVDIERYFITDCRNGNLQGVKVLYNTYQYHDETIEKGYQEACLNGKLNIIKFIESVYLVYKRNFSWCVANACLSGNIDTVEHLLNNTDKLKLEIDNQLALRFACKGGNKEIVDLILKRDCNPVDYSSLEFSIPHPEIYNKLKGLISPNYTDLFITVYYQYACVYNLDDEVKDNIESLKFPINDDIIRITLSYGNIRIIKYLLNKVDFENNINNYIRIVFSRKDIMIIDDFFKYINMKYPHGYIDYRRLTYLCCTPDFLEGVKFILNITKDNIGLESIFKYLYNKSNREDILRYLIYGNYIDRNYVLISVSEMPYIYNKSFTRELLDYFDIIRTPYYLNTYNIKFSYKKEILKNILIKDLSNYLCAF